MIDASTANLALFSTAMGFSLVSSYFDMKTGEIPDKFTVGLVAVALAMRAAFSLFLGDFNYLIDGALAGAVFFGFGALLFYTGAWGGGDAKLVAGIGAALGAGMFAPTMVSAMPLFPPVLGFFIAMSIVAIPYSIAYALVLSIKAPRVFSLTKERIVKNWLVFAMAAAGSLALVILLKPWTPMLAASLMSPLVFYLLIAFTRSVEEVAMQKEVSVKDLRVGDMVVEDIIINGKRVARKRDMDGLTKEALEKIQKAKNGPKKVRIKWGIKFAPAFPLALAISPYWVMIVAAIV
jgi:Flp pilus assembly protein protease CpaA